MALGRDNEWGRPELTRKMMKVTPGQWKRKWKQMVEETIGDITAKTAQYHTTLNPVIWGPGNVLREDVRKELLLMAQTYQKKWSVYSPQVIDVILTGSNANYNWTEYSDLDVHLVVVPGDIPAYNAFGEPQSSSEYVERMMDYLHDMKASFNRFDVKPVKGYNVEVFPQLITEPLTAQGIYSLKNRHWISEPSFNPPRLNHPAIRTKAEWLAREIDFALEDGLLTRLEELNTRIAELRKSGLQSQGEFSTENLVFKVLRNAGAIGHLRDAIQKLRAQELA